MNKTFRKKKISRNSLKKTGGYVPGQINETNIQNMINLYNDNSKDAQKIRKILLFDHNPVFCSNVIAACVAKNKKDAPIPHLFGEINQYEYQEYLLLNLFKAFIEQSARKQTFVGGILQHENHVDFPLANLGLRHMTERVINSVFRSVGTLGQMFHLNSTGSTDELVASRKSSNYTLVDFKNKIQNINNTLEYFKNNENLFHRLLPHENPTTIKNPFYENGVINTEKLFALKKRVEEVENSIPKTLDLCEIATLKYHVATIANLYQFIIQNDGEKKHNCTSVLSPVDTIPERSPLTPRLSPV